MSFEQKSLTLLEVLMVVAIAAFLIAFAFPVGLDFYKSQQLETKAQELLQALRRAQLKAMAAELDSSFGVYLTDDYYVLFKGNSYLGRDDQYDETFDLPEIITASDSPREIVFSKSEGRPSLVGNLILKSDSQIRVITIDKFGAVTLK